jgi:hypothetical protein
MSCITEGFGLNLSYDMAVVSDVYHALPRSLSANAGLMPQIRPCPLSSKYFVIHS